ncbi:molybdenum ABC transporter periplasmic molybdate-binding protein [Moraxella macacae 0408225]|uniref:Molybdenum ABC transporter periplasmic molybdate-binding protein n=1 Tax=Moraxella macacae 0408225 TaxID=1230338 RepID=L2F6T5_9GAMM|nr:molybdate ABC transporter substrate-binding protein [Moraxella macacae]ELA08595.1 molybdenum ABC transporter periplasmic molybdate-binding protein [Moraxella macacae 0408225]
MCRFSLQFCCALFGGALIGGAWLTACQPNPIAPEKHKPSPKPKTLESTPPKPSHHLHLAVTPNLKLALPVIVNEFQKTNPDVNITYKFDNTVSIFSEIQQNTDRYDIFLAGNQKYPYELSVMGDATEINTTETDVVETDVAKNEKPLKKYGEPFTYTRGRLVVYSKKFDMNNSPTMIFDDLVLKNQPFGIAVGNMENLAYGMATKEWLINQNLYQSVEPHLIEVDNFEETLHMVDKGNADFGIASLGQVLDGSHALSLKNVQQQHSYAILPEYSYPAIYQDGIVLRLSEPSLRFVDYLQSAKAQDILSDAGFLPICQTSNLLPACKY